MLSGSALFWMYFLLLSVWIPPGGLVIALCGMIGGFIVDKFLRSAKNHIGAKIGGFMAGFSLLFVLLVLFFNFWSDPVCDKLITGTEFSTEADAPTLGGRMHPSVHFDNRGHFEYFLSDAGQREYYRCVNGQVMSAESRRYIGQYDPVTDTFEWDGAIYTRGYKK
jgi:hypothetical protein